MRLDAFGECRVLDNVTGRAIEIYLLTIGPRILVNWPIAELTRDGPLIGLLDR